MGSLHAQLGIDMHWRRRKHRFCDHAANLQCKQAPISSAGWLACIAGMHALQNLQHLMQQQRLGVPAGRSVRGAPPAA